MQNQFTKGPWRYEYGLVWAGTDGIADLNYDGLADDNERDANGKLMAAAPALYAILKDITDYVSPGDDVPFRAMIEDARITLALVDSKNGEL